MSMLRFLSAAALAAALALPAPARALDVIAGEILPGWRLADGTHMAGLRLTMAPGWKTYWRAPGDAGIPPSFDWRGSGNLAGVEVAWPVPQVSHENGMRSIVYAGEVVLPLRVMPRGEGPVRLRAEIALGGCEDICIPATLSVSGELPPGEGKPDPAIAAALAARPLTAEEGGVTQVVCRVAATERGLRITAEVNMAPAGLRASDAVIEAGDPEIWVSEPDLAHRDGGWLSATSVMEHVEGGAFALDRGAVRITLLGGGSAIDIRGCPGS